MQPPVEGGNNPCTEPQPLTLGHCPQWAESGQKANSPRSPNSLVHGTDLRGWPLQGERVAAEVFAVRGKGGVADGAAAALKFPKITAA